MKQTLFIAVSHGMHVRNLLNSAIFRTLKNDYRIVLLSFAEDAAFLQSRYGGPDVEVEPFVRRPARFESRYVFIRRRLLSNPRRNNTINIFTMDYAASRPVLSVFLKALNHVLGSSRLLRKLWLAFEARMIPGNEYDALFQRHRPAALVTANYGIGEDDIRLIRAARRAKVPSIAVVPSWDNLSSKGIIGAPPDKLLVWNEIMREEATELHDFDPENVSVVGGVQFDVYGDPAAFPSRADFCRRFGLDPERKFIVYGTITPVYFAYNVRVVEMLAQASRDGAFGTDAQVLVRLHPQVVRDATHGDRIEDYQRLVAAYPGTIFLNVPEVEKWGVMSPPSSEDAGLLGAMLHHAAATVVPGSTLALDSLANGTPVVGIAFDGDVELAYAKSIRRWYDFTYYRPLVDLKGLSLAYSRDQMISLVRDMLQDKSIGGPARSQVVQRYLGSVDGKAGQRTADIILGQARKRG